MFLLDPLYRLLGVVAAINGRLWLIRVNMIPANVGLFILLAFGAYTGFEHLAEAWSNGLSPKPQSLAAFLASASEPDQRYVSIEGVLMMNAEIEERTKGRDGTQQGVKRVYAPLVDRGTRRAILVQLSPQRTRDDSAVATKVTGMLRPMDSRLRAEFTNGTLKDVGARFDQRFVLVEADKPAASLSALLLGAGCSTVLLLFLVATAKRNVIFMPDASAAPPVPPQETPAFFVSGKLHLDESNRQRFVNVPAAVGALESGDRAILSNIDASSRWMGMKTSDRAGVWFMAIRPGSMTEMQPGFVFAGWKRLRAVRFRYVSSMDGASEQAVLATTSGDPVFALQG